MKLNRTTSPRLFQEECLAVMIYDRKQTGAIATSPAELNVLLSKLTFRNENWWGLKLRNVASARGAGPPSGNEGTMAEIRKAEELRVSDPSRSVAESMGAFKARPSRSEFAKIFGDTVPYEPNVSRIVEDNHENSAEGSAGSQAKLLDDYAEFISGSDYDELYKWQIAKTVEDNWDLDAPDLAAMIDRSFAHPHQNLWAGAHYFPKAMLMEWAARDPEDARAALRELLHGAGPLADRMRAFERHSEEHLKQARPGEKLNAYQGMRAMALWLGMVLPEQHYLYKSSMVSDFIARTGHAPLAKPGDKYTVIDGFYQLCEEVRALLLARPAIIEAHRAIRDASCHADPEQHLLVQDFIYFVAERLEEIEGGRPVHYWLYAPGPGAAHWDAFREQGLMALGWDDLGDYAQYASVAEVAEKLRQLDGSTGSKKNDANAVFDLVNTIAVGDVIIAKRGRGEYLGYGIVTGEHVHDVARTSFQNVRPVNWVLSGSWPELEGPIVMKTLTDITKYPDYVARLKEMIGINEQPTALTGNQSKLRHMHALNTILYGPPGTGKTYHAITHAVAIIDGEDVEVVKKRDRKAVRARYQELFDARLVRTVTFHQSFSYEDFIEGIKPQTHVSKDGEEEVKQVTYDVQDGIFKLMCASARTGERGVAGSIIDEGVLTKANFYKVSLGQYNSPADDEIYAHCMANNVIAVGYGGALDLSKARDETGLKDILKGAGFKEDGDGFRYTVSVLRAMQQDMKEGDIVFVSAGNSMIRAVGRISGEYFMDANAPIRYKQFRRVQWLLKDLEIPVEDIYPKAFVMGTLYSLDRNLVKKDFFRKSKDEPVKKDGRYVLIIDEINRGNVASIFGELITLIEDDKREGGDEPARVKLPYSKDDFSVPSNLYLLGTMNTADRSVEALDTALRRRFSFVEMPSQPDLVEPKEVEGIDLLALLNAINERVEQLIDKDHHIGHSYFMRLKSGDDLKRVFATKVIPLLEEYFHGDAKKVGAVLGEAFVEVRKKTIAFAKGFDMDEYEVKELYTLKDPRIFANLELFKAIYASK